MFRKLPLLLTGTFLFVLVICAVLGQLAAESRQSESTDLIIEARALLVEHEDQQLLRVHAVLVNQGSEAVTVITRNVPMAVARDAVGVVVDFAYKQQQTMDGRPITPSLYPLAPVTLRPGEATMLFDSSNSRIIQEMTAGETIRVRYQVSEKWGNRWNLWHGLTSAKVEVAGFE